MHEEVEQMQLFDSKKYRKYGGVLCPQCKNLMQNISTGLGSRKWHCEKCDEGELMKRSNRV